MGSDSVTIEDLRLAPGLVGKDDALHIEFTCPRCGAFNYWAVDLDALLHGFDVQCQATEICGRNNFSFSFRLEGTGSYVTPTSRPVKGHGTETPHWKRVKPSSE
jgi:hypothetical protein